jgi:hypothetical protein
MMVDYAHVDHPDDERYDEIHIFISERWKESELSGDEWRFTYVAQIKRKGEVVIQVTTSRLEWILKAMPWKIITAGEEDKFDRDAWERTKSLCDQPGCAEKPVVYYRRKTPYTYSGDELVVPSYRKDTVEYRQFCDRHKHRGDCGLDDADHNYEEFIMEVK